MALVLVTGGAGFIGTHLTKRLLAAGHRVRIVDNLSPQIHGENPAVPAWIHQAGIDFVRASVTAPDDMAKALNGVEQVVHLAAETGTGQSMYEIARYGSTNVQGTAVLLDLLANSPQRTVRRIVLASSRAVYGEGAYVCRACKPAARLVPDSRPAERLQRQIWGVACPSCGADMEAVATREDDPAKPVSIYAATKLAQEHLTAIACRTLGVGFSGLRFQNVYGEGQSLNNPYTGLLTIFSTRLRMSRPLPVFEDGQESRDFVHVDDAVGATMAALDGEAQGPINVGSGTRTSILGVAEALSAAFGLAPDIKLTGEYRLGDIRHNFADIELLRSALGYTPAVSLAEGLKRFAAWVQTQPLPPDRSQDANAELQARRLMG